MNNLNGLYNKYIITKKDRTPVYDRCFVLKPDKDPVAVKALQAYAFATDDDQLREDLYAWVGKPTVEFEPVRHGRWVNGTLGTECSCCGGLLPIVWCPDDENGEHCIEIDETQRCPDCGARMDLEE